METDNSDDIEPTQVANEILLTYPSKKTVIFGLHTQINQFELHLDGITNKYKNMSITWLLATYAAIGFMFSAESSHLQINALIVACIICGFGMIGVSSIWYIDICVYQKFWGAFFIEEVKMEKKHNFLIKIRNISISLDNVRTRLMGHGNFYISANVLLMLTSGIFLILLFTNLSSRLLIAISLIFFAILVVSLMRTVEKKLQKTIEKMLSQRD